jgi:hypothetical protein
MGRSVSVRAIDRPAAVLDYVDRFRQMGVDLIADAALRAPIFP